MGDGTTRLDLGTLPANAISLLAADPDVIANAAAPIREVADPVAASRRPLHVARYEDAARKARITKAFATKVTAEEMGVVAIDDNLIPKKGGVRYTFECEGDLCDNYDGDDEDVKLLSSFKKRLVAAFDGLVVAMCTHFKCKPHDLVFQELVVACVIETVAGCKVRFVGQLSDCNKASGPNPAAAVFIRFGLPRDVVATVPACSDIQWAGTRMEPLYFDYIDCYADRSDYLLSPVGGLHAVTGSELADFLLEPVPDVDCVAYNLLLLQHEGDPLNIACGGRVCTDVFGIWSKRVPFIEHIAPPVHVAEIQGEAPGDDDFAFLPAAVSVGAATPAVRATRQPAPVAPFILEDGSQSGSGNGTDDGDSCDSSDGEFANLPDQAVAAAEPCPDLVDNEERTCDTIQRRLGVVEEDGFIYLPCDGYKTLLGEVQFIHGVNCSMKAVCLCDSHRGSLASSKKRSDCCLLVRAERQTMQKYEHLLRWLTLGPSLDPARHASDATRVKTELVPL